ncbi:MAG: transglutaminase family protein [Flavobacteriales bacterium]|nr:transglutaminase family protein [Flavobacteriales bacterium]
MDNFLTSTEFIDHEHPKIRDFVEKNTQEDKTVKENAISLYLAVRDQFRYNPYNIDLRKSTIRASKLLDKDNGNCVEKAIILIACYRAYGLPSRLHLADVRNHIATERLEAFLGSNLLACHGYTEVLIDGNWISNTPAFNKELCEKLNVEVLEFDGEHNSIFQEYDKTNNLFMEYEKDHGVFEDLPVDFIINTLLNHYPHFTQSNLPEGFSFLIDEPHKND